MKIPKPWLRKQTGTYYVCIDGGQQPLVKDKKEADRKYHRLMAGEGLTNPTKNPPLAELIEQFLTEAEKSCTVDTVH